MTAAADTSDSESHETATSLRCSKDARDPRDITRLLPGTRLLSFHVEAKQANFARAGVIRTQLELNQNPSHDEPRLHRPQLTSRSDGLNHMDVARSGGHSPCCRLREEPRRRQD